MTVYEIIDGTGGDPEVRSWLAGINVDVNELAQVKKALDDAGKSFWDIVTFAHSFECKSWNCVAEFLWGATETP